MHLGLKPNYDFLDSRLKTGGLSPVEDVGLLSKAFINFKEVLLK